ncbi:MAG TPA: hypothetical protein VGH65_06680 [Verrucomicrobiaceae bacterium]|jgi:hypothetical protein
MMANIPGVSCAAALGVLFLCAGCTDPPAAQHQSPSSYTGGTVANSGESKAVLHALHDHAASYQIHYCKIHGDWAWVDVTPLDKSGKPVAEGGPALLHRVKGNWTELDLSKVPADPKDPLDDEDASPGFIRNVQKTYPGVPREIFTNASRH